jgi:hypothetical protein
MRNWHRNRYAKVPHNDRFRNLWRPREGRYRQPRLEVVRNRRARSEREDPEQQLYMSDDEPRAEQTVEVTHEYETTKEPKVVHTKVWGGKGAETIPPPFKNYGDHIRRLRERHDTEPAGVVEEQHMRAFCARFPWVESKDKQSQKGAGILRDPTPDRERDALCQYLHDKHRDLWQRHVVLREGSSVAGRLRFRIGDDFIQLWMAARDWDKQFPKPKRHMWFCHAIRLMARYQAYYAFGIINWWAGNNTAECRAKHRANPLPPHASPEDDIEMVIFCKDCEKKSLPLRDYGLPFMRENNDDPIDDADAAASDGEAREESNFDEGDDQHVDEDEEVPLLHGESGEPTSPTPSSTASDDDAEAKDTLIAEARKYPALKRKADELENELDALRQNIKVEKAKEVAAQAAEKEVILRIWNRSVSTHPVSVDSYDGGSKSGLYFNTPHLVEGGAFTKLREDAFNGKLGQTVRGWEARAREHGNGEMGYENLHWVPDPDPHDDQVKEECFLKKAEEYALLLLTEQGYKRTGPTHEDFTFPTAEERKTKTLEAMEKAMRVMCEQRQQ